jgi:hypothetical protein
MIWKKKKAKNTTKASKINPLDLQFRWYVRVLVAVTQFSTNLLFCEQTSSLHVAAQNGLAYRRNMLKVYKIRLWVANITH